MALPDVRQHLPSLQQVGNFIAEHGKDTLHSTAKVAGACLLAGVAAEVAGVAGLAMPAAFALENCGTCTAVANGTSTLLGYVLPTAVQTTVVCKGAEVVAGLGLFFSKELPGGLTATNWRQVKPADVLKFLKAQGIDTAKATVKVVGGCTLVGVGADMMRPIAGMMGPILKLLPETGISFANCATCTSATKAVSNLVSKVPVVGTGMVGRCLETVTAGGMFFQNETVSLARKALSVIPGIGTSPAKDGKRE